MRIDPIKTFPASGSEMDVRSTATEGRVENLSRRAEDDPMRLYSDVIHELRNYFLKRGATYIDSQFDMLCAAVEAVLSGERGTVTAVPLAPGVGKSTMIRALLKVVSPVFTDMETPLASRLGGIIVVVEKSAEGHELEALCNNAAEQQVAMLVESANDFTLSKGNCPNGTAFCYEDCLRRSCPDYDTCPLMQATSKLHETPILIMLHARYQRYMEEIEQLASWEQGSTHYTRSLLLIDELPDLFDPGKVDLSTIYAAAMEIDALKPSYQYIQRKQKHTIQWSFSYNVLLPFQRLITDSSTKRSGYQLFSHTDMKAAGFSQEKLQELKDALSAYHESTQAEHIIDLLLNSNFCYLVVASTVSLSIPRLKQIYGTDCPSTFIFSGTASLSPEVSLNRYIQMISCDMKESFARLIIHAQRGDDVSASVTGLEKQGQLEAAALWVSSIVENTKDRHEKFLVVTFKRYADKLWHLLSHYKPHLIPYMDAAGNPQEKLPYFGGVNGSNDYQRATCVICVGINRYESAEYINRTLALDADGSVTASIHEILQADENARLNQLGQVMEIQDLTLARDTVQLVYRSALRRHGESKPVELWLLHPPAGMLVHLKDYFGDCVIVEEPELPEACRLVAAKSKKYNGNSTHYAKLLSWMEKWDGSPVTPKEIREKTGLTQPQFKEAKRHPTVQKAFQSITAHGSGSNTMYTRSHIQNT